MTIQEIEILTEYQKEVFMTKDDGRVLESKIDKVQTSLDNFAKQTTDNKIEMKVLNKRMKSAEDRENNNPKHICQKMKKTMKACELIM